MEAQLSFKIGDAQNNTAPFDPNLDLFDEFPWKKTPQKGHIFDFGPPWALFLLRQGVSWP